MSPVFYPSIGGVEKQVEDLCIHLKKLGHTSDVLCLNKSPSGKEKLKNYEKYKKIKIFRVPYLDLKFYKPAFIPLNIIKNYDILHIHGLGFLTDILCLTKRMHKRPVVLSTHGGIFHTKTLLPLKKVYFKLWLRWLFKKIDKIIADSYQDKLLFSEITKNIMVIENSINYSNFANRKKKKRMMVYVGRISKNKRIDHLIDMLYYLKCKLKKIKLYIVGEDWENLLEKLTKKVKEKNIEESIIFTGKVGEEEKLKIVKQAQFVVSASEYEGFGVSVIEAMAAGCIPLLNDIPVFRHFVKSDQHGLIVNYSKPKEAAKRIYDFIRKINLKKARSNAQKTAKRYDWERNIKKIEKIYLEITKR